MFLVLGTISRDYTYVINIPGTLFPHKWENAFTIDKLSWGFRRNMKSSEVLSFEEILEYVVSTVSCGGNKLEIVYIKYFYRVC